MAKKTTQQEVRQLEARLAALETTVASLAKTVGDLKYEIEQMVEA